MKKKILFPVVLICLLLCVVGCSFGKQEEATTAVEPTTAAEVTTAAEETTATVPEIKDGRVMVDMDGREVVVPQEVKKIMTCVTVGTQTVLMLGGPDAVATLGQGFNYDPDFFLYKMYPGLDDVPAMTRNDAANLELVAKINPDVVIMDVADTIEALNGVGVPALMQRVNNTDDLKTTVRMIGELLGGDAQTKGEEWCAYYDNAMAEVSNRTKDLKEEEKPMVWFARSVNMTSGTNAIPDDWIKGAGGRNLAAEIGLTGARAEINVEDILKNDPEVIICSTQNTYDEILADEKFADLSAIKNGRIYVNPIGASQWDMSACENSMQWFWAGTVIQPELFSDVDMDSMVRDYYQKFYGYTLSDEEVDSILQTAVNSAQPAEGRVMIDMDGNEITVPQEVNKIMTCVLVGTQTVLMLGGSDAVATLGSGFTYNPEGFMFKMYPGLENVPPMTRNDAANLELVAQIDPDVVIADVPDTVAKLNEVGIPSLVQRVNNTDDLKTTVRMIGELLGGDAQSKGEEWCAYYDGAMAEVSGRTKDLKEEEKPMVWFARSVNMTSGLESIPDDWVKGAGGRNLAAELGLTGARAEINVEDILKSDPDVIICSSPETYDEIMGDSKFNDVKAVKEGRIYVNPVGATQWDMSACENALQWYWAGTVIQPELFSDVDMEEMIRSYYKQFYNYDLSDAEMSDILRK